MGRRLWRQSCYRIRRRRGSSIAEEEVEEGDHDEALVAVAQEEGKVHRVSGEQEDREECIQRHEEEDAENELLEGWGDVVGQVGEHETV